MVKLTYGQPITESPDVVELLDKVPLTPAEKAAPKVTACVTGATSFVGSHVVRRLLRVGHTVHAPVRDMDENFVGFLKAMPGAAERLKLFKVTSLVDPGAYDEAMKGCEVLHHVASPFFLVGSKSTIQSKLLDPAIVGVENVLATCAKTPTITKVILTGTVLTSCADYRPGKKDKGFTFSEADWETSTSPTVWPYVYAKVVQEKRAEEIAKAQSQYSLSNILIGGTFGPMCSTHGNGISALILKYIRLGLFWPGVPPMGLPMNDVRDVAVMHSLAMSSPKATGRYLAPQKFVRFSELCHGLRSDKRTWRLLLPAFHFPSVMKGPFAIMSPLLGFDKEMPKRLWGTMATVDTSKIEADLELQAQGFAPIPISQSIVDMDLTFRKYKMSALSTSLRRAKTR